MSEWIKEAFYLRLQFLKEQVEILPEFLILHKKLKELENKIQCRLNYKDRSAYLEWLDLQAELISVLIGWFYAKGTQDGVKMLIFLKNAEEDFSRKDIEK